MLDGPTQNVFSLSFRLATAGDAAAICDLVNRSYRGVAGGQGWTHEADWVAGPRTSLVELSDLLVHTDTVFMVATGGGRIVACIRLEKDGTDVQLGMFAVEPALQGQGIGKRLLAEVERHAWRAMGAQRLVMTVISQRHELVAFYERRGYRRLGDVSDYPVHWNVGVPRRAGLTIERLAKWPVAAEKTGGE